MTESFKSTLDGVVVSSLDINTENPVHWTLYNKDDKAVAHIKFQDGAPTESGPNGFTIEDILQIAHARIAHLNEYLPSEENIRAMEYVLKAKEELTNRYLKRLSETNN